MKKQYLFTIIFALLLFPFKSQSLPFEFSYQGRLTDSSNVAVADSTYEILFSLNSDSVAGVVVWSESATVLTVNGLFQHSLGSINLIHPNLFLAYDNLYLEISLSGVPILPRTKLKSTAYSHLSGNLEVYDDDGFLSIVTDGDRHQLIFMDSLSVDTAILLTGIFSGDSSVILPDDAINEHEILNEPGIAENSNISIISLNTSVMTDLVTLNIEVPTGGFVVLHGKCYLRLSGTTGANMARVQIDDSSGGPANFPYFTQAGLSGYVNSGNNFFPIYVTRIFYVTEGEHTFRLEAMALASSPAVAESWDNILTAVFYPTSYGTVRLAPPQSNGRDEIIKTDN